MNKRKGIFPRGKMPFRNVLVRDPRVSVACASLDSSATGACLPAKTFLVRRRSDICQEAMEVASRRSS